MCGFRFLFFSFIIIVWRAYGDGRTGYLRKIRSLIWQERIPWGQTAGAGFFQGFWKKPLLACLLRTEATWCMPCPLHLLQPNPDILIKNTTYAMKCVVPFQSQDITVWGDTNKAMHCRCTGKPPHHLLSPNQRVPKFQPRSAFLSKCALQGNGSLWDVQSRTHIVVGRRGNYRPGFPSWMNRFYSLPNGLHSSCVWWPHMVSSPTFLLFIYLFSIHQSSVWRGIITNLLWPRVMSLRNLRRWSPCVLSPNVVVDSSSKMFIWYLLDSLSLLPAALTLSLEGIYSQWQPLMEWCHGHLKYLNSWGIE